MAFHNLQFYLACRYIKMWVLIRNTYGQSLVRICPTKQTISWAISSLGSTRAYYPFHRFAYGENVKNFNNFVIFWNVEAIILIIVECIKHLLTHATKNFFQEKCQIGNSFKSLWSYLVFTKYVKMLVLHLFKFNNLNVKSYLNYFNSTFLWGSS